LERYTAHIHAAAAARLGQCWTGAWKQYRKKGWGAGRKRESRVKGRDMSRKRKKEVWAISQGMIERALTE
jgi:hypothetical protein